MIASNKRLQPTALGAIMKRRGYPDHASPLSRELVWSCSCGRVSWNGAANYFAYNFIKLHTTLRVTPAMAAGVSTRLMDVMDLVNLLVESEQEKAA